MTAEEAKLTELHVLDAEQFYWRRYKIGQLRSEDLFKLEYALTPGFCGLELRQLHHSRSCDVGAEGRNRALWSAHYWC